MPTPREIARRIDHTILSAEAMPDDVIARCEEARHYEFASVCVNPIYLPLVVDSLRGTDVKSCTVIGFPLGANAVEVKAVEAVRAIKQGADEIDIVAHLPYLLAEAFDRVKSELLYIVKEARAANSQIVIKVIVESALLLDGLDAVAAEQRIAGACRAVRESGCDFIKTSTGFHKAGGATIQAVSLMKKHSAGVIQVKASGGIRSLADAEAMIEAGADRLGCSAGVQIAQGSEAGTSGY